MSCHSFHPSQLFACFAVIFLFASTMQAEIVQKEIQYEINGTKLKGVLMYDNISEGKKPGVMVVHEWWGLNDYALKRTRMLAEMGYVAFAADMYGENKVTKHAKDAGAWMKQITGNIDNWVATAQKGVDVLKGQPNVDASNIAAIGYCFGGATVMQMAYAGIDLKGVVSFHGSLPLPAKESALKQVKGSVLICHGTSDPFVPKEKVDNFIGKLNENQVDFQFVHYAGARHGFTNPGADNYGIDALKHDKKADRRSWQQMQNFFDEIFN